MTDIADIAAGDGRDETRDEQADRNWAELLQELRVVQTGTQILAGFLLTLPFQQRFETLDDVQRGIYVATVLLAVVVTILAIGPVSVHRMLFRRRAKHELVAVAHRVLVLCLALVCLLLTSVALLVLDLVVGRVWAVVGAAALLVLTLGLWTALPISLKHRIARERG